MASFIAFVVLFGFNAVLCCLQLLGSGADTMTMTTAQASQSGGLAARLAAAALLPAVLATLTLTPLLAFAHVYVRELVRANKAGNDGGAGAVARLVVAGLARATLLAATAALLAGAVVQLGADGHLDRGRGDVARLNIK
jgi:hypothetical protein